MSNTRIQQRMDALKASGRKALIPYIVAGDPTPSITVPAMHAMVAAGADVIELGMPFSDPFATREILSVVLVVRVNNADAFASSLPARHQAVQQVLRLGITEEVVDAHVAPVV